MTVPIVYRQTALRDGPGDGASVVTEGLDSAVLSPAGTYLWSYPLIAPSGPVTRRP